MEIKEYISSGIIELYSMHALSPEEMKEVERMAAAHTEVADEIKRVQSALNNYATAHARNPRPSLRAEIINKISESGNVKSNKVIPMRSAPPSNYRLLIAASIVLMLISAGVIVMLYSKWKSAERMYTDLLNEKNELAKNYDLVKNSYDKTIADLSIVHNENAKIITLLATDSTKHYMARVFWNHQTHDAFIDVMSLPVPPAGKQYQLWALVGGKPVDAGVFNMNTAAGMQPMKNIQSADAWAVTLEPQGGSVSPTLSQMYLLSKG